MNSSFHSESVLGKDRATKVCLHVLELWSLVSNLRRMTNSSNDMLSKGVLKFKLLVWIPNHTKSQSTLSVEHPDVKDQAGHFCCGEQV